MRKLTWCSAQTGVRWFYLSFENSRLSDVMRWFILSLYLFEKHIQAENRRHPTSHVNSCTYCTRIFIEKASSLTLFRVSAQHVLSKSNLIAGLMFAALLRTALDLCASRYEELDRSAVFGTNICTLSTVHSKNKSTLN